MRRAVVIEKFFLPTTTAISDRAPRRFSCSKCIKNQIKVDDERTGELDDDGHLVTLHGNNNKHNILAQQ